MAARRDASRSSAAAQGLQEVFAFTVRSCIAGVCIFSCTVLTSMLLCLVCPAAWVVPLSAPSPCYTSCRHVFRRSLPLQGHPLLLHCLERTEVFV